MKAAYNCEKARRLNIFHVCACPLRDVISPVFDEKKKYIKKLNLFFCVFVFADFRRQTKIRVKKELKKEQN